MLWYFSFGWLCLWNFSIRHIYIVCRSKSNRQFWDIGNYRWSSWRDMSWRNSSVKWSISNQWRRMSGCYIWVGNFSISSWYSSAALCSCNRFFMDWSKSVYYIFWTRCLWNICASYSRKLSCWHIYRHNYCWRSTGSKYWCKWWIVWSNMSRRS